MQAANTTRISNISFSNASFSNSQAFFEALPGLLLPEALRPVRVLMVGDVIGRPGRKVLKAVLPQLRVAGALDFVIVNGENLAGGFGITSKIFDEVIALGTDVVTMGNHWADKVDVHAIRKRDKRLVLPQNLLDIEGVSRVPEFEIPNRGKSISVINLMGNFAMKDSYGDPFALLEGWRPILASKVASGQHMVVADIHAEASSEKQAIAWFMDGCLAGLVGTHTHTPTSDERLTAKGTAFLTDVGMTGPYQSVIGMDVERSLRRYFTPREKKPQEVSSEDLWFCGFLLEINPTTGLSLAAHRLQYREALDTWSISSLKAVL